uniref:GnRH-like protein n=1 Tax=Haliotis discus hannai TaxID=42344 RepID=A0A3Q8UAV5_HALDH|nr:GnRH-like protein [Haliotis discus hannai]
MSVLSRQGVTVSVLVLAELCSAQNYHFSNGWYAGKKRSCVFRKDILMLVNKLIMEESSRVAHRCQNGVPHMDFTEPDTVEADSARRQETWRGQHQLRLQERHPHACQSSASLLRPEALGSSSSSSSNSGLDVTDADSSRGGVSSLSGRGFGVGELRLQPADRQAMDSNSGLDVTDADSSRGGVSSLSGRGFGVGELRLVDSPCSIRLETLALNLRR